MPLLAVVRQLPLRSCTLVEYEPSLYSVRHLPLRSRVLVEPAPLLYWMMIRPLRSVVVTERLPLLCSAIMRLGRSRVMRGDEPPSRLRGGGGVRLRQCRKTGGAEQGKHQGRKLHVRVPCAVPRRAHAILRCDVGARSRNRTGMGLPPADFKSDASTSFAIRACSAAPIVAHPQGCGPIVQAGRRA